MKIIHLAAGDLDSGAGQGTRWLHRALLELGVGSEIHASRQPAGPVDQEFKVRGEPTWKLQFLSRFDRLPLKVRRLSPVRNFSCGFAGINLEQLIEKTGADILHLHFINTGFVRLESLLKVNVPIVWTFRDMWPFTGGCHYSWDCGGYTEKCGRCPILESNSADDLSHSIWKRKKALYPKLRDFYPVAISPWLRRCAEQSTVLEGREVGMIWNGVDLDNFKPMERSAARKALGLPLDRPILLLGASRASSALKGYDKLLVELKKLKAQEEFEVVRFGHVDEKSTGSGCVRDMGYVSDRVHLNRIYAAADVFLAPSPQEAFGKTVVESLASGTPAVVFDGSGASEIVEPGISGELVASGDFTRFAQTGLDLARRTVNDLLTRKKCVSRSRAFSDKLCAASYKKLYEEILGNKHGTI